MRAGYHGEPMLILAQMPCQGAPLLRHALAPNLLPAGASLADLRAGLRPRRPQTTESDAKGAPAACGALAQPWPGGEGGGPDTPPARRPARSGGRGG